MNKSALKTFATSARNELLKKVEAKAMKIGITEDNIKKADIESSDAIFIDGKQLSKAEKIQRDKLINRINQIGYKQVMEEVAYTWFNRFTALRYMEVNEYLPTDVRVLSSTNVDSADPDMLNQALELDLEIDKEYVYELKINNKTEELFKYLIIKHCNDLNRFLPSMFEKIDDYTEILFPEGLLAKDSFIRQMTDIDFIPENNWKKVEVIGWLYQYYIAEEKDRVIKAKKKYKTEEISYATQLFTPDWIVRYMVQNSLGRYWVESHPEHRDLLGNWEFYLEHPDPEGDIEEKLAPYINKELRVEDIKCFDPAMGSGHILVYMFDVLYEIYSICGYMEREIPRLILENNLYGLDIDDRAYQLAYFSVVMKALEYNNRFFRSIEREGLSLNLSSIQETNLLTNEEIAYIAGDSNGTHFIDTKEFIEQFRNAKTVGSLVIIRKYDKEFLEKRLDVLIKNPGNDLFEEEIRGKVLSLLPHLLKQADIMHRKYDILVTNPPYMGSKYMNPILGDFIKANYPDTKADTFSAFMELCFQKVQDNGQLGLLTPYVWMYIASYEKLRENIVNNKNISSLVQLEYNSFPEAVVPVSTFTLRNYSVNCSGEYIKLSDFPGKDIQSVKTLEAIDNPNVSYRFTTFMNKYHSIPGSPISFWISEKIKESFEKGNSFEEMVHPRQGLATGNNDTFVRNWYEVDFEKIGYNFSSISSFHNSGLLYVPYNKGGKQRKWYGNNDFIIKFDKNNFEILSNQGNHLPSRTYYFKKCITWSDISMSNFAGRYCDQGFVFDVKGSCGFPDEENFYYIIAFLNSCLVPKYVDMLNPTLSTQVGDLKRLPLIQLDDETKCIVNELSKECIEISKNDWDSFETSWDFDKHVLISFKGNSDNISSSYNDWSCFTSEQFNKLKNKEEEINRLFIDAYGVSGEVNPIIDEDEVTISLGNQKREIKSFLSYAVGCIYGRYSLDEGGLIFAGGEFKPERYKTIKVDNDNILPILPGVYFEDDIVSKFIHFVEVTFGKEKLAVNLDFIAETLGKKKGETAKETIRRYFLNDFFKDHVQTYKKRPIYWLFTSGKQKAFNCLIYMHRYDKTTLSRIRTDYLHEYQIRLDAEKKSLISIIEGDSTTKEISKAKKELKALDKNIEELKEYDELLHHMADMQIEIDLDDGVVVNYEKFKGLVAKI